MIEISINMYKITFSKCFSNIYFVTINCTVYIFLYIIFDIKSIFPV